MSRASLRSAAGRARDGRRRRGGLEAVLSYAGAVLLPPLILAFALQRYLIAGLTAGSVKG